MLETTEDICLVQLYVSETIDHHHMTILTHFICSPNGTKLQLSHQQVITDDLPAQGDVVTVEYDHFSKTDVPVDPKLTRIREDLEWRDVLRDFVNENILAGVCSLPSLSHPLIMDYSEYYVDSDEVDDTASQVNNDIRKPFKFWTVEDRRNARTYLEEYARQRNLDPLLPDTWYSTSLKDILLHKVESHHHASLMLVGVLMFI